jgi:hypothetical protein
LPVARRLARATLVVLCALPLLATLGAAPPDPPGLSDRLDQLGGRRRPTPTPRPTATLVPATATVQPTATQAPPATPTVPALTSTVTPEVSTATPTVVPHDTATALPASPPPVPVATQLPPVATPSPVAAGGVPACPHDPRAWHGLVERDSTGAIACTYGHEHKDNPHALDYAFGPLPAYLGGDISYPWQTFNATTGAMENDAKHRVYGWQVMDLPQCVATTDSGFGFRRARLEEHMDGPIGATTRYHSAWLQAETCSTRDPAYRGFVERGGWIDSGSLSIDSPVCPGLQYVQTPGDNGPQSVEQRLEGSVACPRYDSTWYARLMGPVNVFSGSIKESWGAIDPNNPAQLLFYGGTQNGSSLEPFHILSLFVDPTDLGGDPVTYRGYTDRYGAIVQGCTQAALDCIPLRLDNVYGGVEYQMRADVAGLTTREYDVQGPDGTSLTRYPN